MTLPNPSEADLDAAFARVFATPAWPELRTLILIRGRRTGGVTLSLSEIERRVANARRVWETRAP